MKFNELSLNEKLLKAIEETGYTECTSVQEQVVGAALLGKDLYVQSQTGTGKTAAYLIPVFQRLLEDSNAKGKKALIMVPTRELAVQVEEEAKSLGLPVARLRFLIVACATAVTAACVSMCGLIGWVGLLIPHFVRLAVGSDNRIVVPASFIYGALFLLACDTIARSAAQMEIPVSVLTSLVGAPIFLMLLRRKSTFL